MDSQLIETLIGSRVVSVDTADLHRVTAYRRFFRLGIEAPLLTLHWMLFASLPEATREDGHAVIMSPFPEMALPRRMWAGGEIKWVAPLLPGEELERRSIIVGAETKTGDSGNFLLARVEHRVAAGESERLSDRQDIVFLPAAARPKVSPTRSVPFDASWEERCSFSPVDLFRYSALTLNSHRIHYDAPFAREREGYGGLVVHGPLLAGTLIEAGRLRRPDRTPTSFRYRAVAPSLAEETLRIVGSDSDHTTELAIVGIEGDLRMLGTIDFGAAS